MLYGSRLFKLFEMKIAFGYADDVVILKISPTLEESLLDKKARLFRDFLISLPRCDKFVLSDGSKPLIVLDFLCSNKIYLQIISKHMFESVKTMLFNR